MKSLFRSLVLVLVIASLLAACGGSGPANQQDAINTAVAGTQVAAALAQATVNASALTAVPANPSAAAAPAALATPTSAPAVNYAEMTEEELAALIDQAVAAAIAATEQTTTAVNTTTSDENVTTEEVVYVYDYYYNADYYVDYATTLLDEYYQLYSELANEMITELNSVEAQLNQMNNTLSSIDQSLQEINTTLSQGLELAQESVDQLQQAANTAKTNAQDLKTQAQDMLTTLKADQDGRLEQLSKIQASNIPTDKLAALQAGFDFLDFANTALTDNKLSRDELMQLAQRGKDAQAGFKQFGGADKLGPDISQFSGKFDEITQLFARGQMPVGRQNLGGLEKSLGKRPDFPARPGGRKP